MEEGCIHLRYRGSGTRQSGQTRRAAQGGDSFSLGLRLRTWCVCCYLWTGAAFQYPQTWQSLTKPRRISRNVTCLDLVQGNTGLVTGAQLSSCAYLTMPRACLVTFPLHWRQRKVRRQMTVGSRLITWWRPLYDEARTVVSIGRGSNAKFTFNFECEGLKLEYSQICFKEVICGLYLS
jgi:hypothetical protein